MTKPIATPKPSDSASQRNASIASLKLAITTIEGLVDQQAMQDDWWKPSLAIIQQTVEFLEKVKD